jgi:hypothetical protein
MYLEYKFSGATKTLVAVFTAVVLVVACGGGSGGASSSSCTNNISGSTLELFAGNMGGGGNSDGIGLAASFSNPSGVASDSAGNVYVADSGNNIIRKITPGGLATTLAGTAGVIGSADGIGAAASFNIPFGVATDGADNIYVADSGNNTIRKITPAGLVTTLAGTAGVVGSAAGAGPVASFSNPTGVATDSAGNVYVADFGNNIIRKITSAGVVTTLVGTAGVIGSADGTGPAASFNNPTGVATDSAGNVYVADKANNIIRKITSAGVVTTLAGTAGVTGNINGIGAAASFRSPSGVVTDSAGNVYVADYGSNIVRKITSAGAVTTLAGSAGVTGSTDGAGAAASFGGTYGVATDSVGNVFVADIWNQLIRKVTPAGVVTTLAGMSAKFGSADGTGAAASFFAPYGLATDGAGNIYVADTSNNIIRKITACGAVATLAGMTGVTGGPGNVDGIGSAARFDGPQGTATDSAGNVYVADRINNTIRKITPAGVVTTLAGIADGFVGSTDGIGSVARFNLPLGVATDNAGNVYVADGFNNTIRKITPAGVVSTLAGTARVIGSADGIGSAASFNGPSGVATDSVGNVYVADKGNDTIRKITPTGVVSTLAGTAGMFGSADGAGSAARFYWPTAVATDSVGNVYVADYGNHLIRKITPSGVVSTVVGVAGQIGFSAGALPGVVAFPTGVAISGTSLYITARNGVAVVNNVP